MSENRLKAGAVDDIDRRILDLLRKNARTPFTEMAKIIGVSEGTIRKRVENLERTGVIKRYTVEVDPLKLGYNTITILGLDVEPQHFLSVAEELSELDEVMWVYTSTGDHMIMAEIWTTDTKELSDLISSKIGTIEGVRKLCPAILMERIK